MTARVNVTPYKVAAEALVDETEVSKSRFLCYLTPCESAADAKAFIKKLQEQHPQANHHCYAFVCGRPEDSQKYGFSDDGEPSGTAGKPMLAVLQGSGIGEVCAVVVRYFGGTKLGTGGLQRAYGGSVREAVAKLETKIKVPTIHKIISCQYTQVDDVIRLVQGIDGKIISQDYTADVTLQVSLPMTKVEDIAEQLKTMSSGQIVLQAIDN